MVLRSVIDRLTEVYAHTESLVELRRAAWPLVCSVDLQYTDVSLMNPDATEAINPLTLFTGFHHNAACSDVAIYGKAIIIRMELSPTKYHP